MHLIASLLLLCIQYADSSLALFSSSVVPVSIMKAYNADEISENA